MDLKAIVIYTQSGKTAALVSKYRPKNDIYALCPNPEVVRRIGLYWGIVPVPFPLFDQTEGLLQAVNDHLLEKGYAGKGDLVAITYGAPIPSKCPSNMLRIHRVE